MFNKAIENRRLLNIFTIAILLTLSIFTVVVIAINIKLKDKIRSQIINRDAETFYLFSMLNQYGEGSRRLEDIVGPWIGNSAELSVSPGRKIARGIIALQVLDNNGKFKSAIPDNLIPASISEADLSRLKQLVPISKFHEAIWLNSLFDDPRFLLMEEPVPLLEILIPVHSADSGKLELIHQYWIEGQSMSRELSRLNRSIIIQTVTALGVGYLIILTVFFWAYRQLKKVNQTLYDEIERRQVVERELKRHTEELLQNKEQLTNAQQIANLGSWEWDFESERFHISMETARIIGLSPVEQEISSDMVLNLIHNDDKDIIRDAFKRSISEESSIDLAHRLQLEHHGTIHVRQKAKVIRDEAGRARRILGTIQDVTVEKLTEEETRRLRDMLSNVVDSMPTVLIGVDQNGIITQWNREAERITGMSAEQALNQSVLELYPETRVLFEKLRQTTAQQMIFKDEKAHINLGNFEGIYDITTYPLVTEQSVEGAVLLLNDVSERVKLEEMMIQTEKMHTVGGLAAGMAHEINNPLAIIIQNLQLMRNRLSENNKKNDRTALECGTSIEAIRQYMEQRGLSQTIDNVLKEGQRAADIVMDMLNFSRKPESSQGVFSAAQLLDKSLELASNEYDLKKNFDFREIQVVREYDPEDIDICGDKSRIQQVFLNILKNGAHAMANNSGSDRSPKFTLRIYPESAKRVCIEIEDNGPGMDNSIRQRAFEPFFTTKKVGEGTGLGLSVSYFIVSENNGSIDIRTQPGQGTTFIINLPAA